MDLTALYQGSYRNRRVLVTGHTGFKGSWLYCWLSQMGAEVFGLALDPEDNTNHWQLLGLNAPNDHRIDIRNADALHKAITHIQPEIIFHLAAQPFVRRSYADPVNTFQTNITGTINLFEAIRNCPSVTAIVNATTDKVYAERSTKHGYSEDDKLGGHDPYSTSKACAELISESYQKCFFTPSVRLATARSGNVIGGGDWGEDRLVPDAIRCAQTNKPIQLRYPDAIRPWQHVLEPLSGYLLLGQKLLESDAAIGAWNFGPDATSEITVSMLLDNLRQHLQELVVHANNDRNPHEAAVLRLNHGKARVALGWQPIWGLEQTLAKTAHWYADFHAYGRLNTFDNLHDYVADAKALDAVWTQ
jgi:CDP-glucose 4,6-dehydratase